MSQDVAGAIQYFTIAGSIFGILGFIIAFSRWLREKPILKFRKGPQNYYYYNHNMWFNLNYYIDNVGDRGTTLTKMRIISLDDEYLISRIKKYYEEHPEEFNNKSSLVDIVPNSSEPVGHGFNLGIVDDVHKVHGELTGEVRVTWTHCEEVLPFELSERRSGANAYLEKEDATIG